MLTRLKVRGFKNLIDTELRFGAFTCIAGANGVGKSNLFDAIAFLSRLADESFVEAALATRGGSDLSDLFTTGGDGRMHFDCEMVISARGEDDFRQQATASQTFLRYELTLRLTEDDRRLPRIELESERLTYIPKKEAREALGFPHQKAWRDSILQTSHRRAAFIDVEGEGAARKIRLSSDRMRDENTSKRGGGRPAAFPAATLPRTVLSAAQNADEARTAVLARVEMRSWRILQLEPSALRQPNDLQAPTRLGVNGANLAATLYRIALSGDPGAHCADISNRLAGLIDEVRSIKVDRDDARRLLQVVMTDRAGLDFPASSLSDGTLRFIALSVLERDPEATGITCLEEPENGIHPERMGAMIDLLRDMSVDCEAEVSDDNPLRQVIVSTHSPIVAARVSAEELVFAERRDARLPDGRLAAGLALRALEGSWRDRAGGQPVARGRVLRYLGSFRPAPDEAADSTWQRFGEQLQFHFGAAHANT